MYKSLLEVSFGGSFPPDDRLASFCPDCPQSGALLNNHRCAKHSVRPVEIWFQDGRVTMVMGAPLLRDGVPILRAGDHWSMPSEFENEWKVADSPYRLQQVGTGVKLTLLGFGETLDYCILSHRFPAVLRLGVDE